VRRGYVLAKWQRRADTLHRKAVDLSEEINEQTKQWGSDRALHDTAVNLHCVAAEMVDDLKRARK
jgi:hypothetical protein